MVTLVINVISMTNTIVNSNTCPSVMTEVPEPFALVVTLAHSFMLGILPTLRLPR